MYDFSDFELDDLKEAQELYKRLDEIGMGFADDDCLAELNREIEKRKEVKNGM